MPIDFINVYSTAGNPANNAPPILRHFKLTSGSCGGRSYLFTSSLDPTATCTVNFSIEVDSGANKSPTKITIASSKSPAVASVDATNPGTATGLQEYSGSITFSPNATDASSTYLQAYTQVGLSQFSVSWEKKTGQIDGKTCTAASSCTGTFEGGGPLLSCTKKSECTDETWQHATYVSDPIASKPIMSAELTNGSGTPIVDSWPRNALVPKFTIELTTFGIDQQRVFLIRDSVQNTGNRTHAIDCGQGNGGLKETIEGGCPDPVGVNVRNDDCSPQPAPAGYRDCVRAVPGNKTLGGAGDGGTLQVFVQEQLAGGCQPEQPERIGSTVRLHLPDELGPDHEVALER